MNLITPPWTDEQVTQLNRFQRSGYVHPFTCGHRDRHDLTLVATPTGWECPDVSCDYTQTWAHSFMADKEFMDGQEEFWAQLMRGEPE